jgi:hypothetical protein
LTAPLDPIRDGQAIPPATSKDRHDLDPRHRPIDGAELDALQRHGRREPSGARADVRARNGADVRQQRAVGAGANPRFFAGEDADFKKATLRLGARAGARPLERQLPGAANDCSRPIAATCGLRLGARKRTFVSVLKIPALVAAGDSPRMSRMTVKLRRCSDVKSLAIETLERCRNS